MELEKDSQLGRLIDECVAIENERKDMWSIIVAILPPDFKNRYFKDVLPVTPEDERGARQKCDRLGGVVAVLEKLKSLHNDLLEKLSSMAEILEEQDFEIARFRDKLEEEQVSWLNRNIGMIKQQLKGINIT